MRNRKVLALGLLLPLLLLTGCPAATAPTTPAPPTNQLQKISTGLDVLAKAVGTFEDSLIQADQQGTIPHSDALAIMAVCLDISNAGKQADSIVRTATTLDGTTANKIIQLLTPASQGISAMLAKYPTAKYGVQIGALAIQSAISALQLSAAGGA